MDYKYIEQLLERYWNCETSVEEEQILRIFFRQKEVPPHLCPYRSLFAYQEEAAGIKLGDDFDSRILAEIERPVVKARRISLYTRFMPLFKAAAMLCLLWVLGGLVKYTAYSNANGVVYVYDQFDNRATDPQVAYEGDSVRTLIHGKCDKPQLERSSER